MNRYYTTTTPYECQTCGHKVAFGGGPRGRAQDQWHHRVGGNKRSCGQTPIPTIGPSWAARGLVPVAPIMEERHGGRPPIVGPHSRA